MYSAGDYPLNQHRSQSEGALTLESEPEVEATIVSLKQHFEEVRQHEVKRTRGRLGELSSIQEKAIESLTRGIIDQILETPIIVLKAASEDHDTSVVIETVHRISILGMGRGRTV